MSSSLARSYLGVCGFTSKQPEDSVVVFCWFPSVRAGGAATWGHCVLSRFTHKGLGVHMPYAALQHKLWSLPLGTACPQWLSCSWPFPLVGHHFRKFNKVCFLEDTWRMQKQVALGRREESVRTAWSHIAVGPMELAQSVLPRCLSGGDTVPCQVAFSSCRSHNGCGYFVVSVASWLFLNFHFLLFLILTLMSVVLLDLIWDHYFSLEPQWFWG